MKSKSHDNIFAGKTVSAGDFVFDEAVSAVFPDMLERSVPGYSTMLAGIAAVAESHVTAGSNVYDLGCSQGAATAAAGSQIPYADCTLIAIDNSESMIARCRENLERLNLKPAIEVLCTDLLDTPLENASLVIMNLTLQFIDASLRQDLLQRIYDGMLPGGALVVAEKTILDNDDEQALMTNLYHAFKRVNGYSQMEISRKRTALENVLVPESESTHLQRFLDSGFSQACCWLHCFGFKAFIAIK